MKIDKAEVIDQLEPLTRRHYEQFARCDRCEQVYWSGSHHRDLAQLVEAIVAELATTGHRTSLDRP